jgi:hypothetical protein
VGEVAAVLQAVFEGARRAGEAVGEARAESLLGGVGEAVVGESGESGESVVGTPGSGVARRGRLLEGDADAAASGVFDGLLGLVVEVVVLQAVTGKSQGAEMGAGARATHPSDRRTCPRSTRRTMEGSIAWMGKGKGRVRLRASAGSSVDQRRNVFGKGPRKECVWKGTKEGMCSERDKGRNVLPF